MKLEKYEDKNNKRKKAMLISLGVIVLISISFLLFKTFANFTEQVSFPIMSGKVDYFGNSDIYFVFYKNGELVEDMPQKNNEENMDFAYAECDNGAEVTWNESEWAPLVKNLKTMKTKCSLYFERTKYYVSESGSDDANGNKETPLRTIKEAYSRILTTGKIILLSNLEETEGLEFNSNKNVTITSEDGIYEIDRGTTLTSKPIINLTNKSNLTLTNIIFNGKEISSTRVLIDVNNSSLTINDGTIIENNKNSGNGGGIRTINDSRLIINGGEIKNNESQWGGGIAIHGKTYFEMNGGSIIGNRTNNTLSNGAGIYIATDGHDGSIINIKDGLISKNISLDSGGGLGISNNCGEIEINITGGTISENEATLTGGGIRLSNGVKTTLNISGGTIENNQANYGGGLWIGSEKTGESINKITTATIRGNHAISGGGLYIQSNVQNATYEIDGTTIEGNVATQISDNNGGVGGGIRFNGIDTSHVLTLSNNNIINNQAYAGGGIFSTGKLIIDSGKIESNKATTDGGGILTEGELEMNDGTISENTATINGGGIEDSGKVVINNGEITNNQATWGGGLYLLNKCEFEMNGGSISNNNAEINGGGVELNSNGQDNSVYNFNGGEIKLNQSGSNGGGIKYSLNSGEATLNLKGTNILENTAGNWGGGIDIENNLL